MPICLTHTPNYLIIVTHKPFYNLPLPSGDIFSLLIIHSLLSYQLVSEQRLGLNTYSKTRSSLIKPKQEQMESYRIPGTHLFESELHPLS